MGIKGEACRLDYLTLPYIPLFLSVSIETLMLTLKYIPYSRGNTGGPVWLMSTMDIDTQIHHRTLKVIRLCTGEYRWCQMPSGIAKHTYITELSKWVSTFTCYYQYLRSCRWLSVYGVATGSPWKQTGLATQSTGLSEHWKVQLGNTHNVCN